MEWFFHCRIRTSIAAAPAASRDIMRQSKTIAFLSLLGFTGLTAGSLGSTGCFSQCAAACVSTISAAGTIDVPADKPDMKVALCLNGQCAESTLTFDAAGAASCDGVVTCELTQGASDTHLTLSRYDLPDDIDVGDEIQATVEVVATGDMLIDAAMEVTNLTESSICGSTCDNASVFWEP